MAKLYFRYGVVKSTKTTLLLAVRDGYQRQHKRAVLWKPERDTRDETFCVSRLGLEAECDWLIPDFAGPDTLLKAFTEETHVVLVDEAQFLTRKNVEGLRMIADQLNIPVICYGLRSDWQGHLFKGSAALFCLADTIEEVKMVCWHENCNRKASFNQYTGHKQTNAQVIIGHDFQGVCFEHWPGRDEILHGED